MRKKKPAPYVMHDAYFLQAKKEGYRARSVYKLQEIQERFSLIEPHMSLCDIWAAPGSFLQYINRIIDKTNLLVGIDIKPIDAFSQKNIFTIEQSIFDFDALAIKLQEVSRQHFISLWAPVNDDSYLFDLITSDIAPNTTGRKDVDQYASVELNIEILKFSQVFLKKGGNLLLKVFKGEDFFELQREIQKNFSSFTEYKPQACRDRSFEEYIICWNKL